MIAQWNSEKILLHRQAADLLALIKDEAFAYIFAHPTTNEYEVQKLILRRFQENNLVVDKDPPIVAFGPSAAIPHYFPKQKSARTLGPNTLILIDIWAKLNQKDAPFADITWTGFYGDTLPDEVLKIYVLVNEARDAALNYLQKELKQGQLPTGQAVNKVCRDVIAKAGYDEAFSHSTGHSIGFTSPHGIWGNIRRSNAQPLIQNLGYTIEPGIYLANKFGVRSEINFYIDSHHKLIITTPVQSDLK